MIEVVSRPVASPEIVWVVEPVVLVRPLSAEVVALPQVVGQHLLSFALQSLQYWLSLLDMPVT